MTKNRKLSNALRYYKNDGALYVARVAASKCLKLLKPALGRELYQSLMMWLRLGYWPNIRDPRSFNEKVTQRNLFNPHPLTSVVSDKLAVRDYILVEKLLVDREHPITLDYKYYVFHGEVRFLEVVQGRFTTGTYSVIYDRDWRVIEVTRGIPRGDVMERPANFVGMVRIAERIGQDFDFCRVDLYSIDGERIVFGEINVTTSELPFRPRQYDALFGSYW